ncbi:MAG TPA: polyphosphate kinase 2 family protein [Deinococcales bacterium]|nr:polyphosphate kinase 2 family protein [Deinococcales bacterium]
MDDLAGRLVTDTLRVRPVQPVRLARLDPGDTGPLKGDAAKEAAREAAARHSTRIAELQERLYASRARSLLVVLQAMDTGGKDGTIKNVFAGVNPQGVIITSFKAPTYEELAHDFLWRVHARTPARGMIGVFNRSHYEDVLVTRVHGLVSDDEARRRFASIRDFERLLCESGTTLVKFFLHISREEQRERLQARIDEPDKRWKFDSNDLVERRHWDEYQRYYEEAINATSEEHAPWYVVPADHKWYRNLVVSQVLVETLEALKLSFPPTPVGIDFDKLKVE